MTEHSLDAEPGRYEGTPTGMNALIAAWHQRRANQRSTAAAVNALGLTVAPGPATASAGAVLNDLTITAQYVVRPGAGDLEIEGQKPGVEERPVRLPELLIPAAIIVAGGRVAEGELVEAVAVSWVEIIKELERDPHFLHQLDWRKVEELIAGAYTREGWPEVILTLAAAIVGVMSS